MSIKDQDGKIYTLRGPNPLMLKQEEWDLSKITLLNMNVPIFVMEDKKKNIISEKTERFDFEPQPVPVEEVKEVKEEKSNMAVLPPPAKPVVTEKRTADLLEKHKTLFHCLPVIRQRHFDPVYQEESFQMVYGEKFVFPAVIVEEGDLQLVFWADRDLNKKTIVFPKNKSLRCWKVEKKEKKSGGFLFSATPSDISPDFS